MAEWRYIKPLNNENSIEDVEKKIGYKFCSSFVEFAKRYNGARPPIDEFDTDISKGRTIKTFLSLNETDTENIVKHNKYARGENNNVTAFAIDNFGNYICFDNMNKNIIFLDYETGKIEIIAKDFETFLRIISGNI